MRIVMLLLICCLSLTVQAAQPTSSPLTASQLQNLSKIASQADSPFHGMEVIKSASFQVSLNQTTFKTVILAALKDQSSFRLVLLDAEATKVLQELPAPTGAVTTIFAFVSIKGVSFADLNEDGTLDILVVTSYFDTRPVQGKGVGGGYIRYALAYLSHDGQFEVNESCAEKETLQALKACELK